MSKQKLELTWIGKEKRPKLEPRILLEDLSMSYHADLGSIPAGPAGEPSTLTHNLEARKLALLRESNQRNLGYFEQEVQKLDAWADDLKLGLEQEIKAIDREIKEVRRSAAISPTLEEKLSWQKKQRELEGKRSSSSRWKSARCSLSSGS